MLNICMISTKCWVWQQHPEEIHTAHPDETLVPIRLIFVPILITFRTAIGFNVETVTYRNLKFQVWDLGGQTSIRWVADRGCTGKSKEWCVIALCYNVVSCSVSPLLFSFTPRPPLSPIFLTVVLLSLFDRPYWRCYYSNTDAVIYVVDSSDRDRMGISKSELVAMLEVSGGVFSTPPYIKPRYIGKYFNTSSSQLVLDIFSWHLMPTKNQFA